MKNLYFYVYRIYKVSLSLFTLILIFGCASTDKKVTNITPAELIYSTPEGTPAIGMKAEKKSNSLKAQMLNLSPAEKDTLRKYSNFKTFSVMPLLKFLTLIGGVNYDSLDNDKKEMLEEFSFPDRGTENKVLFELRNFLEEKGYLFVPLNKNPDVIFCISGLLREDLAYIPPSLYSLPKWVPSKTITEKSSSSGILDFSSLGDYSSFGWGNWSSTTKNITRVPGYFKTETYTRPGYSVKNYYPAIIISGRKIVEKLPIFDAHAIGFSTNPDFSVNAQFVIKSLIEDLPEGFYNPDKNIVKEKVGIEISVLTNDGADYFPTIMKVKEGSPAHKAGIKLYDMILAVNNKELSNESYSQVIKYLSLSSDSLLNISLWRVDKRIDTKVNPWK